MLPWKGWRKRGWRHKVLFLGTVKENKADNLKKVNQREVGRQHDRNKTDLQRDERGCEKERKKKKGSSLSHNSFVMGSLCQHYNLFFSFLFQSALKRKIGCFNTELYF